MMRSNLPSVSRYRLGMMDNKYTTISTKVQICGYGWDRQQSGSMPTEVTVTVRESVLHKAAKSHRSIIQVQNNLVGTILQSRNVERH
jgi:hypothetical protein